MHNLLFLSYITKILVIRFSSIGDIVLTSPVVRCLKKQVHGQCELHYLVKKEFADIVTSNPYIDKVHILDNNRDDLIEILMKEGFDYIIDLHKNLRSHYFRQKLGALAFSFNKLNIRKWILVNFKVDLLPDLHIVDRYFEAVKALAVYNDGLGLDYVIPPAEEVDVTQHFGFQSGEYIAFSIGGAHAGKKLPLHKLREICAGIRHPMIIVGGPGDKAVGDDLASGKSEIRNACGQLSLHQSASVLKQSRLVITHDSGLMHIAAAFRKKIISIWGATVPKFGMYPYMPHPASVIIEADHLKFRPTSKLGNRNSPKERRTLEEIDASKVILAAEKLWNSEEG